MKTKHIISIIVLILIILFLVIINPIGKKQIKSEKIPDQIINQIDKNTAEINIESITQGKSEIIGTSQQYEIEQGLTAFEIDGLYDGIPFTDIYQENETIYMKISNELTPNDNIIEGYIIEKIEDENTKEIYAYIFLDNDWKNKIKDTKIFWGSQYQFYLDYEFNEISDGIYMMKIPDDPARFSQDFSISAGGIAVGNLQPDDIINDNIEGKTIMRLYS